MSDIANDLTTTASVSQGRGYNGTIDTVGDEDWIAVELTAGITYAFYLQGSYTNNGTLEDPYIKGVYDADGNSLNMEDDDSGDGRESLVVFTPDVSGTYYVSAGSWDGPYDGYDPTGTYSFSYGAWSSYAPTPYSEAFAEQIDASGNPLVDSLLSLWRYKNIAGDETLQVTYSFPTTGSVFSEDSDFGYGPAADGAEPFDNIGYINNAEKEIFDDAVAQLESFLNIDLVKVADNADSAGTIRIAWTGVSDEDAAAWAYYPYSSSNSGDIWLLKDNLAKGGFGSYYQVVVLHELGHALGLKHSFDDGDGTGDIMPAEYDGLEYTLMSYTTSVEGGDITGFDYYPTTYMYYDILALQHMYGAIEAATGDTTYTFEAGTKYFETIWDTGGTDTYDASAQTTSLRLDLTPGSWSDVGTTITMYTSGSSRYKSETVFTPEEVIIEKAIGGSASDEIIGNSANNVLQGGAGNDEISGGAGDDTLRGDDGDDTVSGGAGNDVIWAGAGDTGDDVVSGGDGADQLAGGAGNDLLYGGNGADIIFGGSGADTLSGDDWSGGSAVVDETSANQLWSGAGDDVIFGGNGNDSIGGGADDDLIDGKGGDDIIYAGATGNDTLLGGDGADIIFGGSGNDSVDGGNGADELYGGSGNDNIFGGAGDDTLYGGTGDDTLAGGLGGDTLRGGAGADTFVFTSGGGDDVVGGFSTSEDILDLGDTTTDFTDLASVQAAATETDAGVLIDLGGGDSVLLEDLSLADLASMSILYI